MYQQKKNTVKRSIYLLIVIGATGLFSLESQAQLALESDINQAPSSSSPGNFYVSDEDIYFAADDGEYGEEIWKYNTVTNQVVRVTDLAPNAESAHPEGFYRYQNLLFFNSVNTAYTLNLDTEEIERIGGGTKRHSQYTVYNNTLYFSASSSSNNTRIYSFDTDNHESILVLDFDPNIRTESVSNLFIYNDTFYFTASGVYYTLDASSGTATLVDGISAISAGGFTELNGLLYFKGEPSADIGRELMVYNPATQESKLAAELWNGAPSGDPSHMYAMGDLLVFRGRQIHIRTLYIYNPSTDEITKMSDINPGEDINAIPIGAKDGLLYFVGNSLDEGIEIFTLTPEQNIVTPVSDFAPGSASAVFGYATILDDNIYFGGRNEEVGYEFFKHNLSSGEDELIADINTTTAGSHPNYLTAYQNKIYFTANPDEQTQQILWSYNPGTGSTEKIINPTTQDYSYRPDILSTFGEDLYLHHYFESAGNELARYNENTGEFTLVHDIHAGTNSGNTQYALPYHGKIFFDGRDENDVYKLFAYDPSDHSIDVVVEEQVDQLFIFNDQLFGFIHHIEYGEELFSIDDQNGTIELIADIRPGENGSNLFSFIEYHGKLYFSATDGQDNLLRAYDPQSGMIESFSHNNYSNSKFSYPVIYQDQLIFVDRHRDYGTEIFRFDDSNNSFILVADLIEGSQSGSPRDLTVFNDKLYFTVEHEDYGRELWEYNNDAQDAQIVSDIWEGPSDSDVKDLVLINDKLYFSADDGEHGAEIWSLAGCLNSFVQTEPETDGDASGSIDLTVAGGIPPYTYLWDNGAVSQDLSELHSGEYTVTVRDQSGCISVLTATVDFLSGTNEILDQQIKIFPTYNSGHFTLQYEHGLTYEVIDLTGKMVHKGNLSYKHDDGNIHQQPISLHNPQPGMYLIKLNTANKSGVFKFIIY